MAKHLSRRTFFRFAAVTAVGTGLAACGATPTATPAPTATKPPAAPTAAPAAPTATKPPAAATAAPAAPTAAPTTAPAAASKYKEAPALTDLVKAGKLPPVEQRLPANPVVYTGPDGAGVYGGTFKTVELVGQSAVVIDCYIGYQPLTAYNSKWGIEPNLAESWKMNEKATEFTFTLRKGVKWSDGSPFSADDVMFWWNDIVNNKDYTPVPAPPGQISNVEKVDDLTIKFTLKRTNVMFMDDISHPGQISLVAWPAHYCKKFHAKYNADAQSLAKAAGLERWQDLLAKNGGIFSMPYPRQSPGVPTLTAWTGSTTPITGTTTQFEVVRNPFFWKVDSTGQQYPYADKVQVKFVANVQAALLEAAAGNLTFQRYHVSGVANRAFHIENSKKGNYRIHDIKDSWANSIAIYVNLNHAKADHNKVNRDLNFRIGLSHAINRKEMIDTLYLGMLKPFQVAPLPTSPYYNQKLATQYLDYDAKKANEYLDKVLPKKDGEGYRLGPDGQQYLLALIAVDRQNYKDLCEMLTRYWKAVGVRAEMRLMDRATWDENYNNKHEFDSSIWSAIGGQDVRFAAEAYLPAGSGPIGTMKWQKWSNNPQDPDGEEPPDNVKKQIDLYRQTLSETDDAKRLALWKQVLDISADMFYCMGISTPEVDYYIVNNDLKNVPDMFFDWAHGLYGPTNPWAFFFKK